MSTLKKISLCILIVIFSSSCSSELKTEKQSILERDERNEVVDFSLIPSKRGIKFCVNNLTNTASSLDVFRTLLHASELLKDRNYEEVYLCFRNEVRFVLSGSHFKKIGEELKIQNPMYTMRTFPEKLLLPNGKNAYSTHNGGALYLMRVQLEDFKDMNDKWFMNELSSEIKSKLDAQRPKKFAADDEVF